jgi:hypothetical protein
VWESRGEFAAGSFLEKKTVERERDKDHTKSGVVAKKERKD